MKKIILLFFFIFCTFALSAQVKNMEAAEKLAKETNKAILIKFSGSDWCAPCIALNKNILETADFKEYAKDKLIILAVDFPRQKKNQLSKEQQKWNEQLADKYNPEGKFPYLLLIDAEGNILKTWSGYDRKLTVEDFEHEINQYLSDNNK